MASRVPINWTRRSGPHASSLGETKLSLESSVAAQLAAFFPGQKSPFRRLNEQNEWISGFKKSDFWRYVSDDLFGQECRNLWLLSFSIFLNFLAFKRRLGRSVVIGGKRIDGICWPHTLVSAVGIDRVGLLDTCPSGFITEKLHFTLFENWKRSLIESNQKITKIKKKPRKFVYILPSIWRIFDVKKLFRLSRKKTNFHELEWNHFNFRAKMLKAVRVGFDDHFWRENCNILGTRLFWGNFKHYALLQNGF